MKIRSKEQLIHELIRFRKYRKWSQSQLAEETGISQQALSKLERGEAEPTLSTLFKIISALEIDLEVSDRIYA